MCLVTVRSDFNAGNFYFFWSVLPVILFKSLPQLGLVHREYGQKGQVLKAHLIRQQVKGKPVLHETLSLKTDKLFSSYGVIDIC